MPSLDECSDEAARALTATYGAAEPASWSLEPAEALVFVYLDRVGSRPETVLDGLREAGLLDPAALAEADPRELAEQLRGGDRPTLRPGMVAGLQRLAAWAAENGGAAGLDARRDTEAMRDELRALRGIGAATADALLLLALRRTAYPVDRSSYRVMIRHGWLDASADYDEARQAMERLAPGDPTDLARWSDWMDRLGRQHCRASGPRCDRCPLRPFLPECGPREPDA